MMGNAKLNWREKEINFQDLKKADGGRCSYIILIYCFIVQSANIKTNVTGKDTVHVPGIGGSWGTGDRLSSSSHLGADPPCLGLPAVGRCPAYVPTIPTSLEGCRGRGSGGTVPRERRDGAGVVVTTEQHSYPDTPGNGL